MSPKVPTLFPVLPYIRLPYKRFPLYFDTFLNVKKSNCAFFTSLASNSVLTDRHRDPPSPVLPRGEVRLPVQSPRRHHRRPHGGAAASGGGQREAGEDEEGRMNETIAE